ncbi:hypothetical protein SLE2022_047050 [Rubroshorea leprosula]
MDKPMSGSESGATTAYNTVFIDTNLDTHLAMIVSDSDTVSDLKKKIVEEHPLCFPSIGEIKVHALKVKRRGFFYYLSDLMSVRSAFEGVSKSWFLSVDASSVKGQNVIMHSCKPDSRNLAACFDIANNNSSADVVDLLPDGPSRRLPNINDSLLRQVADKHHEKQNLIAEQFCSGNSSDEMPTSGNSSDEVPKVLQKKVERLGYDNFKDLLCPTSNRSVPQLQDKFDVLGKEFEDPRTYSAPKDGSIVKKKHKTKKRNEDAGQDCAAKENDLLVLESVDNASKLDNIVLENSFRSPRRDVSYNMNGENQHVGSSKTNNESGTGMDTTSLLCTEIPVRQKHIECENDKPENGVISKHKFKSPDESPESGPTAKKKHKTKKTSDNDIPLTAHGASISDAAKRTSRQQEMTTSSYSLSEKLGSGIAISDNIELLEDNLKLTGIASSRKRKRKEQTSNPGQVVGAISLEKDEETNKIPCSAENDISNTGVGKVGRQSEAADLEAGPVKDKNVLVDQCANRAEDHLSPMIQEVNNLQDNRVSSQENQTFAGEDGTADLRKSSRKKKKSSKTRCPDVGVSMPSETGHVKGSVNDVSPTKLPKSVNDDEMGNIGAGNGESPNEESGLEVMPVKNKTILMNQHAGHVKGHASPTDHGLNNLQENMVSGHENQTVAAEDGTINPRKSSKKKKMSRKTQDPDVVTSTPINENNISSSGVSVGERKNETADLEAVPVKDMNILVDQQASHVKGHPSPVVLQELNNLCESRVVGPENLLVSVEDKTVEAGRSSRKRKKSRKTQGSDVETSITSGTEHLRESNTDIVNRESKNHAADVDAVPVKDMNMAVDQHAIHLVEDHSYQQESNYLQESRVTGLEDLTVAAEAGKFSRKKKKSRKNQGPDEETSLASGTEHHRESKNYAADVDAVPVKDMNMAVDQHAIHLVEDHSYQQESNNLQESRVTGLEDLTVAAEAGKFSRKKKKSRKNQGLDEETSLASGTEHHRESKNYAADVDAVPVKDMNMAVDQHAIHLVEDHSYRQESNNLQESRVTGLEDLTVAAEAGKFSRKKKKSRKIQDPDEETSLASGTEHHRESNTGIDNGESKNYAVDVDAMLVKDMNMIVDQHANYVEDHSSLQEPNNLPKSRVTGPENLSVAVEDETMEAGTSSRKRKKSRKIQGPDAETSVASGTEHSRESLGDVSPTEPPISTYGENLSDKAEKGGLTELKEASKIKTVSASPADDKGADEVIRDVLESLQQCNKDMVNQDMDKKSKKKTKKKESSTLVENIETKGKDDLDHYNPNTSTDSVTDMNPLAESSKENKVVNTTSMNKLNRSKKSQKNAGVEGNWEVHDGNKSINAVCEDERIEKQHQHEAIASSEKLACIVTDKKAVDDKANGPGLQSTGSSSDIYHSVKSSENHISGGNAQVVSYEPIQNQKSSSKNVNESDSLMLKSNKKLPSISGNGEKLMKSNESPKLNTPQEAQTPTLTNCSSRIKTKLKFAASTSGSESSKIVVPQNRSGNAHQSHLPVRKAQRNDIGDVVDSSEPKRGLIVTSGTIFKDDGKETSDDEDKTDNSDSGIRTPNKSSSSGSSDSDADSSLSDHGSYGSKGEGGGGRKKKKSMPSSPKSLSLEAILRSSSRYKKAKLTFSQSQYDAIDSQPDEFVPDSQPKKLP